MAFHKKKWAYQLKQRGSRKGKKAKLSDKGEPAGTGVLRNTTANTISGFLRRAQDKLLHFPWQIIQVQELFSTEIYGRKLFQLRALDDSNQRTWTFPSLDSGGRRVATNSTQRPAHFLCQLSKTQRRSNRGFSVGKMLENSSTSSTGLSFVQVHRSGMAILET